MFTPGLAGMDLEDAGEAPKKPGTSTRHLIVVGVLALGVGVLYFMRQVGGGPTSASADVQIDYQFADREAAQAVEEQTRVIEGLKRSGEPSQLPAEALGKNPFRLRSGLPIGAGVETPSDQPVVMQVDMVAQQIEQSLASLQVQAVIDGRVPIARISGETYREGDRVDDLFDIVEIGGRAVVLESERGLHRLEMHRDETR